MQNSQNLELSLERRNQILDLIISELKRFNSICQILTDIRLLNKISPREYKLIKYELMLLFINRSKEGHNYKRCSLDVSETGFTNYGMNSNRCNYYFKSYEDRIEFLKGLKTQ